MRPRATILVKLLAALVLPTVALFTLFALVAYQVSRRDLDDELGRRLAAIAASAATQVRGKYLVELVPGDEADRGYQNALAKLQAVAQATGARLFVFDRTYDSRVDTAPETPIGLHYFRAELDRNELARVFERGRTAWSVTFLGRDGKFYKSGYAAVHAGDDDPQIVLAIGAQAPASYFTRLDALRGRLFMWGGGLVGISILAAIVTTFFITRNVRRLAAAAERIGEGDLRARISIRSRDELGVLGETMERMRQQLAERDARTQQMLAGIAHEVRNPLAGMTLFAGILREELPADDERRGHVDKIERELGYLDRVVNDFLEYARRPRPELEDLDLRELLDEVAQLASTTELTVAVASELPPSVRADRAQLRRALLNLANNAVQAATAAGHDGPHAVRITARRSGHELAIQVWNRGAEIAPETSGRLFEPFFTTREKGTGLGLAFVREIAVDHGGRVEVASADGETTFSLVVPV